MAITQAQSDKDWRDYPDTTTPITASDLEAMSRRSRDYRWMIPTGHTSVDEFDDDTLDAAWTRVDTSGHAGYVTWGEGGDSLGMKHNTSTDAAAELHALVRPVASSMAVGDGYITCATVGAPLNVSFSMGGLLLADGTAVGAGNQLFAPFYAANGQAGHVGNLRSFTGYNTSVATSSTFPSIGAATVFIRIARVASTSWRADYSLDGMLWLQAAALTSSITPTHVGFGSSNWANPTEFVHSFEFLRRVTGVS